MEKLDEIHSKTNKKNAAAAAAAAGAVADGFLICFQFAILFVLSFLQGAHSNVHQLKRI